MLVTRPVRKNAQPVVPVVYIDIEMKDQSKVKQRNETDEEEEWVIVESNDD